jgi:hypothetical protein
MISLTGAQPYYPVMEFVHAGCLNIISQLLDSPVPAVVSCSFFVLGNIAHFSQAACTTIFPTPIIDQTATILYCGRLDNSCASTLIFFLSSLFAHYCEEKIVHPSLPFVLHMLTSEVDRIAFNALTALSYLACGPRYHDCLLQHCAFWSLIPIIEYAPLHSPLHIPLSLSPSFLLFFFAAPTQAH